MMRMLILAPFVGVAALLVLALNGAHAPSEAAVGLPKRERSREPQRVPLDRNVASRRAANGPGRAPSAKRPDDTSHGSSKESATEGAPADAIAARPAEADRKSAAAISHPRHTLAEPSDETLAELDALVERENAAGLLEFYARDRSLARFQALREALRLSERGVAGKLVKLLAAERDAGGLELLAEGLGAGAGEAEIPALIEVLEQDERAASRLAAARALIGVQERGLLDSRHQRRVARGLGALWSHDPEAVLSGLAELGPEGRRMLVEAGQSELPTALRLRIAGLLIDSGPAAREPAERVLTRLEGSRLTPEERAICGWLRARLEG